MSRQKVHIKPQENKCINFCANNINNIRQGGQQQEQLLTFNIICPLSQSLAQVV